MPAERESMPTNLWNYFQHINAGKGWTRDQMRENYYAWKAKGYPPLLDDVVEPVRPAAPPTGPSKKQVPTGPSKKQVPTEPSKNQRQAEAEQRGKERHEHARQIAAQEEEVRLELARQVAALEEKGRLDLAEEIAAQEELLRRDRARLERIKEQQRREQEEREHDIEAKGQLMRELEGIPSSLFLLGLELAHKAVQYGGKATWDASAAAWAMIQERQAKAAEEQQKRKQEAQERAEDQKRYQEAQEREVAQQQKTDKEERYNDSALKREKEEDASPAKSGASTNVYPEYPESTGSFNGTAKILEYSPDHSPAKAADMSNEHPYEKAVSDITHADEQKSGKHEDGQQRKKGKCMWSSCFCPGSKYEE